MRDLVARWVADRLTPRAAQIDSHNEFPRDLWPELGELGSLGITAEPGEGQGPVFQAPTALSGCAVGLGSTSGTGSSTQACDLRRAGDGIA